MKNRGFFLLCFLFLIVTEVLVSDSQILKDGPVTICGDALRFSQKQNVLTYSGNVVILQVKNTNILCEEENKALPLTVSKLKKNYSVWINREHKNYAQIQDAEYALAKPLCLEEKQCRFLAGQELKVFLNAENKIEKISLTADKTAGYLTRFYSFGKADNEDGTPIDESNQKEPKPTETHAKGDQMEYYPVSHQLVLQGHAWLEQSGNTFSGQKIVYDTETKLVTVPNDGERASIIINTGSDAAHLDGTSKK
jgi:lipopolysaccharide transport protein LptA